MVESRHERGYGYEHVRVRKALLHQHVDGSPCYWCDLPLFKDALSNWDQRPLAADHSELRAREGGKADRLLHTKCNSQRQDGSHDDERPAATGIPPWEWAGGAPADDQDKPRLGEPNLDLGTRFFDWPEPF